MANDENDRDEEYRVGYGKPPHHTRFRKGQSGNPNGRPRGSKNLTVLLNQELDTKVVIRENGQQRQITKRQAAIKQLVNKMVSGDRHSTPYLYKLKEEQDGNSAASEPISLAGNEVIDPEDARKLQEAWKAIQGTKQKASDEEEDKQ